MIMTRKEYKELKDSGDPAWENIEALRNVARAANVVFGGKKVQPHHAPTRRIQDALDSLPEWMLEDE